ncbi:MAG: tetratricopeptide repeat protein [bacterium]|nr:tetratricopeptide repeat protein [bacterium]
MANEEATLDQSLRPALDLSRTGRIVFAAGVAVTVLALFPLTPSPAIDIKYLILAWTAVSGAFLLLAGGSSHFALDRGRGLPAVMAVLFLLVYVVACFASRTPWASLMEAGRWMAGFGLFFAAMHLYTDPAQVRRLMLVIVAAVCVASLYGFVQKAGLDPFPWGTRDVEEYRGLPATFGNPNVAAHTLILAVILACSLASRKGAWRYALFLAPLFLHVYWTRTRGSMIALAVGLAILAASRLLSGEHRRPVRRAVTVLLSTACAGLVLVCTVVAVSRTRSGTYLPTDGTALVRYHAYYDACRLVRERPLLGFGPLQYRVEAPRLWTPYEQQRFATVGRTPYQVHNDWFEMAVESGLTGAVLYIGFIVSALTYCLVVAFSSRDIERRRLACAGAACLATFAVDGIFGFPARVPVSRTIVLMVTGAILGATLPAGALRLRRMHRLFPAALAVIVLCACLLETRVFAARMAHQAGRNAEYEELWGPAQRMYEKSVTFCPWDWPTLSALAEVRVRNGDSEGALGAYHAALGLHPNHPALWVGAGRANLNIYAQPATRHTGAEDFLNDAYTAGSRALEICSVLPAAHELLARVCYARAMGASPANESDSRATALGEAVLHSENALACGYEDRGTLLRMLASAHAEQGDVDAAVQALTRSIESEPDNPDTWRMFANLAEANERYADFVAALNRRLDAQAPPSESAHGESLTPDLFAWLGWAYARSNDETNGQTAFLQSVTLAPNRLELWQGLTRTATSPAELGRRLAEVTQSLRDDGVTAPAAVAALTSACLGTGQDRSAALMEVTGCFRARVAEIDRESVAREYLWIAAVVEEVIHEPSMPPAGTGIAWYNLASMLEIMQRHSEASNAYSQAFGMLPENEQRRTALVAWVRTLTALGKHAEALEVLAAHEGHWPDDVHLQYTKARALTATGQRDEGLLIIDSLLENPSLDGQARQQLVRERQMMVTQSISQQGTNRE